MLLVFVSHLFAIGANHLSAPIEVREQLSFAPDALPSAIESLRDAKLAEGVVIVSTCNRTELYLTASAHVASDQITEWLSDTQKVSVAQLRKNTYQLNDTGVPRHLFRVAAGLDSMALGEPQILGQLKDAYQRAVASNSVDSTLNQLFQHAFHVAKNVRTRTRIGDHPISMVYAATKLPSHFFGKFHQLTTLIVGAGETAQLATKNLANMGIQKFIFANRTLSKAQALATHYHGYAIKLAQIKDHLHEADLIFSATASPQPLICQGMIDASLAQRKQRMQLYLDLSVPRNVELLNAENAYLFTVDDLKDIIERNISMREESAQAAENLIDYYHQNFLNKLARQRHTDLIKSIQATAKNEKEIALTHAMRQLNRGDSPEVVIERLASTLSKKMAHQPMKLVHHASDHANDDMLALIEQVYDSQ